MCTKNLTLSSASPTIGSESKSTSMSLPVHRSNRRSDRLGVLGCAFLVCILVSLTCCVLVCLYGSAGLDWDHIWAWILHSSEPINLSGQYGRPLHTVLSFLIQSMLWACFYSALVPRLLTWLARHIYTWPDLVIDTDIVNISRKGYQG